MYIPTWILIVIILGICFYYFNKRQKEVVVDLSKNAVADDDWFEADNWREIMLQHLSKYPKRTNKKSPTYEEMLTLDKDEFKSWIFLRSTPDFQDELIKEMLDHEEKTGSFTKTAKKDDTLFTKLILDVFNRERSKEVIDVLRRMSETANKLVDEGIEGEKGDSVRDAILAKSASDYYKLGDRN